MSNKDFDGFVKSLQPQAAESSIDWAKRREEWLRHLEGLYTTIISFLRDYIQKGEIKTEYHPINLNEEHIGSYQTRKLTLKIGSREIALRPIGTLLIAAKGRVDVEGPAGKARFVLVPKDVTGFRVVSGGPEAPAPQPAAAETEWVWKIATYPPTILYKDLTRDTLFEVLMEVTNG